MTVDDQGRLIPDVGYCPQYRPQHIGSTSHSVFHHQSVAEQMGVDPVSKLADAINNLADALRETQGNPTA